MRVPTQFVQKYTLRLAQPERGGAERGHIVRLKFVDWTLNTSDTLPHMNTIHRINHALAQIVALLNVAAAVVVVLITAAVGYMWSGIVGLLAGLVLGLAIATVLCGLLALLINIRDLLAQSLPPRS